MGVIIRERLAAGVGLVALIGAAWAGPCAAQTAPFRSERFDEDWPAGADGPFGARIKNLPLAPDWRISFGGDARWRLSAIDAPRLGFAAAAPDAYVLQRLLLHADLRFDRRARAFFEIGAHDGIGRDQPSPSDEDRLDLQQGFIDIYTHIDTLRADLRVGRQELVLGPRFVTARDSGNVRQRHDMARLVLSDDAMRLDLFAGRPTRVGRGAFDDDPDPNQTFIGARFQHGLGAVTGEVYVYDLDRDAATFAGVTARDDRLSLGARVFGRFGVYDLDAEIAAQRGRFGAQHIRAHGGAIEIARRFEETPMRPRLGARLTYGQGDRDPHDSRQETFTPPFPSGSWFGQNGLASYSNIIELASVFSLSPREDVTINAKLASLWRDSTADDVYAGGAPLDGASVGGAFTNASASLSLTWRPSPNVSITPYVSYSAVSEDLAALGAHDVSYGLLSIALRF